MKRAHVILALGLIASAGLVLFGDAPSRGSLVEPAVRTETTPQAADGMPVTQRPARRARASAAKTPAALQKLIVRSDVIAPAGGPARPGLFEAHTWVRPPAPSPAPKAATPAAPPLPFTYIGRKFENGSWEVYLSRGEESFVARPGGVLDGLYEVQSSMPPYLVLVHSPTGERQSLYIGGEQ